MKNIKSGSGEKDELASALRSKIKGKAAIVGIGNIIRGDDGLGPRLINILKEKGLRSGLFDCGTVPENYIIPILSTSCDTLILIDAADLGLSPGKVRILELDEISTISFSTHAPSPRLFTDLIKMTKEDIRIVVISVQPKSTKLGESLSEEVNAGLELLADALKEAIS